MPVEKILFQSVPRIFFGAGAIENLAAEIRRLGGKRVALVTDPGIAKAGLDVPVRAELRKGRLGHEVFSGVEPDPPIGNAEAAAAMAREMRADVVVGLGGGSAMDTAKAAAVLLGNPGPLTLYAGVNQVPRPGPPTMFIPTTAGTGSEATCVAVLTDTERKVKMGVFSDLMFGRAAFLDPALTLGLPPAATAHTGLDALIHGIESYTGRSVSLLSETLALQSIELAARHLRRAYADGGDLEARAGMLKSSLLAGMAFTTTQCAAAHSFSMALGGAHHIPHGLATTLFLPAVMEYNLIACPEKFARIAEKFGESIADLGVMEAAEAGLYAVLRLIGDLDVTLGLENYGVSRDEIDAVSRSAHAMARLWNNNPRTATLEQVKAIMERAFSSAD